MRILLVHNSVPPGASPDDADVLVQAGAVREVLVTTGHRVKKLACGLDLEPVAAALRRSSPDVVFNLVESLGGSGRLIHLVPSVIESMAVPMAGCSADAIYLTSHKTLAKSLLHRAGLPTPAWYSGDQFSGEAQGHERWIIKSVWEDASLGLDDQAVVQVKGPSLPALISEKNLHPGAPWFAEAYIEGREFNIALLDGPEGPVVLPCAEMLFDDYPQDKPRIVGYAAKWHEDSFEYSHTRRTFDFPPADLPLLDELSRLAVACWHLFGLRGWARVDFRIDQGGRPWILEANANPCLAPDAGFAAALDRAGLSFSAAVKRILAAAR
jgi:D-alanine-D-alanine ligase